MKLFAIIAGSIVLALIGFGWWFSAAAGKSPEPKPSAYVLQVETGDGVRQVADKLFSAGYISSRWQWNLYIVLTGKRSNILEGEYSLTGKESIRTIANIVTHPPEGPKEITVKLLEGWSAKYMAQVLSQAGVVDQTAFLDVVETADLARITPGKTYLWLSDKPKSASLEGYLFPDTYRFFEDSTPEQVVAKLLENFNAKFSDSLRTSLTSQGRDVYETVILASIVERELQTDADRAKAADIFLRRIEAGIPLQSDATVNYVTGKSALQPTYDDLQIDSPYNTYKYPGLPPGPIGNPGLSALRAAVNPEANPYYYFLTGTDGKTHFAKTLEEHVLNRQKYLD